MKRILDTAGDWRAVKLNRKLARIANGRFVEGRGCILLSGMIWKKHEFLSPTFKDGPFEELPESERKRVLDHIGYENQEHLHLEDCGVAEQDFLRVGLKFMQVVLRRFREQYPSLVLNGVLSIDVAETSNNVDPDFELFPSSTVRFHVDRPDEIPAMAGLDSDDWLDGALMTDSNDPWILD